MLFISEKMLISAELTKAQSHKGKKNLNVEKWINFVESTEIVENENFPLPSFRS